MRIPRGKLIKNYKIIGDLSIIFEEAITLTKSGYIRITEDRNGLNDYYIFFNQGKILGAYAEFEHGESIRGEEAKKAAMNVRRGIFTVYYLGPRILDFLIKEENLEVVIPYHENKVVLITGVRIPLGEKKLATTDEDCASVIGSLRSRNFTGYIRVRREKEGNIEDGIIVFLDGMPRAALLEHGNKAYKGDSAIEQLLKKSHSKRTIEVWELEKEKVEKLLSATKEATTSMFEIIKETKKDRKALLKKYGIKEPDEGSIKEILKYYSS